MHDEALQIYLFCTAALAFNLFFLTAATGASRAKAKVFVNGEDASLFKGEHRPTEADTVDRVKAAHRNALESIPLFLVLALLYILTGAEKSGAMAYFITFTVARWLHSFFYLRGMQPWRTVAFGVGLLVNVGLTIQIILAGVNIH
ncbi:MAG: MAPEG family protein [Myxococcales bacterium]|nr:MAPEG family protein [Myxococcales bacterium]